MPRVCKICTHPQSLEIDRLIAKGEPYRGIARQFDATDDGITRHVKNCIPVFLEAARSSKKQASGIVVEDEINRVFRRLGKVLDACDEWLTDPEDAAKYSLDARDSELMVIYDDLTDLTDRGKPKRKRGHLSELLRRLEEFARVEPVSVSIKRADPRDLIVKTAGEIKGQLELFARLKGLFQRERANESDREHDREMLETIKAEVQRLIAEGWSEADARAIVMEAEPLASQLLQ